MKKIIIRVSDSRLDRYLKRVFPFLTQGNIEKLLRKKDIILNGQKAKSSDRLQEGDEVSYFSGILHGNFQEEVSITKERSHSKNASFSSEKKHFLPNVIALAKKILGEYLVFDCEYFIAIDKPNGLAVQGGSKISLSIADSLEYLNYIAKQETLQSDDSRLPSRIEFQKKSSDLDFENVYGYKTVHRLDKNTSGLLIIAKGYESAVKLTKGFKDRVIKKEYTAITCNSPKQNHGEISGFIGKKRNYKQDGDDDPRNEFERVEELPESDPDAKFALTEYEVIEKLSIREAIIKFPTLRGLEGVSTISLIEYKPQTGRMHQLRVHSKLLGCPIIGDVKYGGPKAPKMMLHAKRISIPRDIFGTNYDIQSKFKIGS